MTEQGKFWTERDERRDERKGGRRGEKGQREMRGSRSNAVRKMNGTQDYGGQEYNTEATIRRVDGEKEEK